jgi:hypothetical protein
MGTLTYIAQVAALVACSWLVYKAVFARDTLHRTRRAVLLALLAASFALPVCRITLEREIAPGEGYTAGADYFAAPQGEAAALRNHKPSALPGEPKGPKEESVWRTVWIIYLAGVAVLSAYRLAGVARVRRIMRRAVGRYRHGSIEVLLVAGDIPSFSFGGRIVMCESDRGPDEGMILRHEATHIRERHGADLAAVNIAAALLWFNPFVWLLRRELILVHELAADSGVIESGIDAKQYQYLLISKVACEGGLLPVVNHFRTSDLRKRIVTMKKRSSRAAALKLLLLAPLVAAALAVFAHTRYVAGEPTGNSETTTPRGAEPQREPLHVPFDTDFRAKERPGGGIEVSVVLNSVGVYGKRPHPVTGEEFVHSGIDIGPDGDTLPAPWSGVVKSAASAGAYGNKLVVTHAEGLETLYAHLAGFLVAEGETVKGGQPIAIVGDTGHTSGKHLHLETRVNGESTDPLKTMFGVDFAAYGSVGNKFMLTIHEADIPGGLAKPDSK